MVKLIMLGGPGSGKTTIAQKIAQHFDIPFISTGKILRQEMKDGSELGLKAKEYIEKGELVPNMVMIALMKEILLGKNMPSGWVLDGYPRTAFQAEELDFLLEEYEQKINAAIYLQTSSENMIQRSLSRGRMDDSLDAINNRIANFDLSTTPILEYYQYKHTLLTISGDRNIEAIETEIFAQVSH